MSPLCIPKRTILWNGKAIDGAKRAGDYALKKKLSMQRKVLLTGARGVYVSQEIRREYLQSLKNGHKADIFCISNKWYQNYFKKNELEYVNTSGVPSLRKFCYNSMGDEQLKDATNFLKNTVPALIYQLANVVDSHQTALSPEHVRTLATAFEKAKTASTNSLGTFEEKVKQIINNTICQNEKEEIRKWQAAAIQEAND
jgi:hypothetical protein